MAAEVNPNNQTKKTMPAYNPDAQAPTYEIVKGVFPFEIIAVEQLTSGGAKTNGCPERKLTLAVYNDTSFKENLTEVKDSLYDHPSCDWKFSVLAKCVGVDIKPGEAFDIDECWKGFRGFAEFHPEPGMRDKTKLFNKVKGYLTDQPMLAPNKVEDPFAE